MAEGNWHIGVAHAGVATICILIALNAREVDVLNTHELARGNNTFFSETLLVTTI